MTPEVVVDRSVRLAVKMTSWTTQTRNPAVQIEVILLLQSEVKTVKRPYCLESILRALMIEHPLTCLPHSGVNNQNELCSLQAAE